MSETTPEITVFPVSVMIRRTEKQQGPWRYPAFEVSGLLPEAGDARPGGRLVHTDGPERDYLWQGLRIKLVRSNAETYWFNLNSTRPTAYVICREDPEYGLMPVIVTLDHDEAMRDQEGDGEILTAEIPDNVRDATERFVMAHYEPREPRRRRRRRDDD